MRIDFSLFKPNMRNMNVHRATCSCSVELYKQWFTLADFFQTGIFAGFSLYIIDIAGYTPILGFFAVCFYLLFAGKISEAAMYGYT